MVSVYMSKMCYSLQYICSLKSTKKCANGFCIYVWGHVWLGRVKCRVFSRAEQKNENVSIYADIEVNYTMGNPGILIFLNSTKQEESRI